jgi:hypothetical protein
LRKIPSGESVNRDEGSFDAVMIRIRKKTGKVSRASPGAHEISAKTGQVFLIINFIQVTDGNCFSLSRGMDKLIISDINTYMRNLVSAGNEKNEIPGQSFSRPDVPALFILIIGRPRKCISKVAINIFYIS